MSGRLMLFWDFDAQWGAERSRSGGGAKSWGNLDFTCSEKLLKLLSEFRIRACFAVVGAVALGGDRPYHDPELVRSIAQEGHEIASHAMHHEWLPGVGREKLKDILRDSKAALEDCVQEDVMTFAPPYNQPFDYSARGSISLSERREVPKNRVDLGYLCRVLRETGYRFCRVAYQPLGERIAERMGFNRSPRLSRVEQIQGIAALRVNAFGFRQDTLDLVQRAISQGGYVVCFAHPHSLDGKGPQGEIYLHPFLERVSQWVNEGRLEVVLPREVVSSYSAKLS